MFSFSRAHAARLLMVVVWLLVGIAEAQDPLPYRITYDPATGKFTTDEFSAGSALQMVSTSGIFVGEPVSEPFVFFRYGIEVFRGGDLGPIAMTGLTTDFLRQDLCVSLTPRGPIQLNGELLPVRSETCNFPPDTETPIDSSTPLSASGERRAMVAYDAATGAIRVDVSNPHPTRPEYLTVFNLKSRSGLFTGEPSRVVESVFDIDRDNLVFLLRPHGVQAIDFGPIAKPGLTNSEVVNDLCAEGAWHGGGWAVAEYHYPGAGLVPMSCASAQQLADVDVDYDSVSGDLMIDVTAATTTPMEQGGPVAAERAEMMTTLEIRSASGVFTGSRPATLDGPHDRFEPSRVLKQNALGFETLYLRGAVAPGLSRDFLLRDLTIDLTTLSNSRLGNVAVNTVPEPAGAMMLGGTVFVCAVARRRGAASEMASSS